MTKNNKKGFTIIEVVLVLAIAGLIFLMVFIALPALQRSQRNTRRRQDMARILSAVNDYQANNNNQTPSASSRQDKDFVIKYVDDTCSLANGGKPIHADDFSKTYSYNCTGDKFKDPDGSVYTITLDHYTENTGASIGYTGWGGNSPEDWQKEHRIHLVSRAKCTGDEASPTVKAKGESDVAIVYVLEGGAIYCGDNQ